MSELVDNNWKGSSVLQSNAIIGPDVWIAPKPEELPGLSDIWKASNLTNLTCHDLDIPSSLIEDSVDAVRGSHYQLLSCIVRGSSTIKGAIKGFLFGSCIINGTVELGQFDNYWYYGRPPTTGIELTNCTKNVGDNTIYIKLWNADMPAISPGTKYRVTKMPKFVWVPYFISQYLWVRIVNLFLPTSKKHATS